MPAPKKLEVFSEISLGTDVEKAINDEQRAELGKVFQSEYEFSGRDLFYFGTHVRTWDEDNDCVRPFPVNFPYLRSVNQQIDANQAVIILKSRRLLVSWLGMLRQLHGAIFCGTGLPGTREVFEGAIFTIAERQAIKMMDRVRFMWKNLPTWVQDANPLEKDTQLIMRWQKGGVVQAFPHAQDAPRGSGFSEVFFDEMAFQIDVRALWKSLIPTLGRNGKLIAVSTPNGRQNLFAEVWRNEENGYTGIHRITLQWDDNPEHDQGWFDAMASKMERRDVLRELMLSFSAAEGKLVFPTYDPQTHEIDNTIVIPSRAMLIGWDFGFHYPACYPVGTQALTANGWENIEKIKSGDRVCTLNPKTKEIKVQRVTDTVRYKYTGDMYRWSNNKNYGVDLTVTANHMIAEDSKNGISLREASEVSKDWLGNRSKGSRFLPSGKWHGKTKKVSIPSFVNGKGKNLPPIDFSSSSYAEFMGIYLAEGSSNATKSNKGKEGRKHYITRIWQKNQDERIEGILNRTPLKWNWWRSPNKPERGGQWYTSSVQLVNHLHQFGKCRDKFVPNTIKNMSADDITKFLWAYAIGDGHIRNNRISVIYTSSKRMADDLQELFLKTGVYATISHEPDDAFAVRPRAKYKPILAKIKCEKTTVVNEDVACISVPNGIIAVRQNGMVAWCGNCTFSQYNSLDQYVFHREYRDFDKDFISYCRDAKEYASTFFEANRHPKIHFVDPAGFQPYSSPSNSGAMCDVEEIRRQWGADAIIYPGALEVGTRTNEGPRLKSVRRLLKLRADGRPGLVINKACVDLCTGFSGDYCYPKHGGETPDKNEASHPMDALQYTVTGHERIGETPTERKQKKQFKRVGHRTGM